MNDFIPFWSQIWEIFIAMLKVEGQVQETLNHPLFQVLGLFGTIGGIISIGKITIKIAERFLDD